MSKQTPEPKVNPVQTPKLNQSAASTGRNALMLLFGTFFRMVITFVFILYAADRLGVVGFGSYSIGVQYFELFVGLAGTAIAIILTRDITRWQRRGSELMTSACVLATLLALLGVGCMLGMTQLFGLKPETSIVIAIASISLVPAALSVVFEATLVAHHRSEFVALAVSIESTVRVLASIAAIFLGYGLVSLFVILMVSRLLQLIVFYISVRHVTGYRFCFRRVGFVRFTMRWRVFAAEVSLAAIYYNLDVIVLSWLTGEYAVGLYSAASRVVRLVAVFAQTYTSAVFPVLAKLHQRSKAEFEKVSLETIRVMAVIAIPVIISTTLLADRVIGMLYFSGKYVEAVPVLQVLIWILLSEFYNPFLSRNLSARGRQDLPLVVAVIGLTVNVIATFSLVPLYGAVGAALGTVISNSTAMACFMCFALRREELITTLKSMSRVAVASVVVGFIIVLVSSANLAIIAGIAILAYCVLILLFKVVGQQDWELFKSIIASRNAA